MKIAKMYDEPRSPVLIEPGTSRLPVLEFLQNHAGTIKEQLLEHGAILFRGFPVCSVADFESFVGAVSPQRLDYVYGSTPRTALGNRIFTATEYPATEHIPLHNENAYQREWPMKIALCCLVPASSGGETPIADMRKVTARIGESLMGKFATLGVKYVRHYRPHVDVSWQKVFRTEDRSEVARFCGENDITHEWLDDSTLRTMQTCQGTAKHPVTGDHVFFNQAHLFHVSSLGAANAKTFIEVFGADKLPRQTYFGNGAEISDSDLDAVRKAYDSASISFPWEAGDVMLLDNMQFAHGRRPYKGERRVLAALMEPHSDTPLQ
jgi:alpha-ketoglutarate-dependent taurine dioxygenase